VVFKVAICVEYWWVWRISAHYFVTESVSRLCPPWSRKFIAFTGEHLRSRLGSRVLETEEVINLVAQVSLLRDRRFLLAGRSCDVDIKMQHLQCDMGNVLDFDDVPTPVKPG
jgi:hypothetical protein